jgi:hypothetical protein
MEQTENNNWDFVKTHTGRLFAYIISKSKLLEPTEIRNTHITALPKDWLKNSFFGKNKKLPYGYSIDQLKTINVPVLVNTKKPILPYGKSGSYSMIFYTSLDTCKFNFHNAMNKHINVIHNSFDTEVELFKSRYQNNLLKLKTINAKYN